MSKGPKTITSTEARLLIEYVDTNKYVCLRRSDKIKYRLMILLMLDAGLRVGEVVNLQVGDLMVNGSATKSLLIRAEITKTKTERQVPLTERIGEAIRDYYDASWKYQDTNQTTPAFCGFRLGRAITVRAVQIFVGGASHKAFGRAITPHTLRHSFATRLMKMVNIRVVQQLLGHKALSSTQVYTHPDQDDLTNAIKAIQ